MKLIWPVLIWGVCACAEPQPVARGPEGTPSSAPEAAPSVRPAAGQPGPDVSSAPQPEPRARDAAVPALSSPNPLAPKTRDAGSAETDASADDPRTRALRAIALSAQACHAKHTPGVPGKLVLLLERDGDGRVTRASLLREASDKALLTDALERCVVEAAKREKLPAPIGSDDGEIRIPLTFTP